MVIEHDKDKHRFYVLVEGHTCLMDYTPLPDGKTLEYYHTYTPPELRGRKLAEAVVTAAIEYAKANDFKVIPSCSYVQYFLAQHPEYSDVRNE